MNLYHLFLQCVTIKYNEICGFVNYKLIKKMDTLYVFFEDSKGVKDWLVNLNFPVKPYKQMNNCVWFAHRGFIRVWKALENKLKYAILDKTIKKFIVVGYSHGAAIAVLCYEYIWFNRPDVRDCLFGYGFGSPRVFWGFCRKELKTRFKNFTLIRNANDIITHLPFAIMGYFHTGNLLKLKSNNNYSCIFAHKKENILESIKMYEKK